MPARAPILLAAAVSLSVLVGCTVTSNITDEPAKPAAERTVEDGVGVWDLREPPTAADVAIQPGEKTSDFQTGIHAVSGCCSRRVSSSRPWARCWASATTGIPTASSWTPSTRFVKSAPLEPSAAYEGFKRDLAAVGLPPDATETWLAEMRSTPTAGPGVGPIQVRDFAEVGYLAVAVLASYSPVGDTTVLSWTLTWAPPPRR